MSNASLPSGLVPNWVAFGFASAAAIASIIAWSSGAKASPTGDLFKKSFGATVKEIDTVPWLIIAGLFVVALVVAFATAL